MRKLWLLFIIMFFPIFVFAKDTCDSSNIKIKSITLEDTRGNIEEISEANISGQKINLGLKMNVLGDSAEYKIVLKNDSDEDYYFDEKSIHLDSHYVSYDVSYEDGSNIMKGGEEKVIFLKVSYQEKVSAINLNNGIYRDNVVVTLDLTDKNIIEEILDNPLTGRYLGIIVLICMMVGLLLLFKDKKKSLYLFLLIGIFIPFTVNALCKHSLEIETNLVIDGKEAIFLPGREVNIKIKMLANDNLSSDDISYTTLDYSVVSILKSSVEPDSSNKEDKNIVSVAESPYPIYMWYEEGIIYWWSEDNTPALNEDSSYFFCYLAKLSNIVGVENYDLSNTKSLQFLLAGTSLYNLDSLEKWNTFNVFNLQGTFGENKYLLNMNGVKNWDVRNVSRLSHIFLSCYSLEEVDLSNWQTAPLVSFSSAFGMWTDLGGVYLNSSLKRIKLPENIDTSEIKSLYGFLANNQQIEDYSFLQYLDVGNVSSFEQFFQNNNMTSADLKYIENWDVSSATTMRNMFYGNANLTALDVLSNWDISKLTNMSAMFRLCTSLRSIDGIYNWDVSKVTTFEGLFWGDSSIEMVDLSHWNTSSATNMADVFYGLSSAISINVSNWNTENVTDMRFMFYGLSLEELDISSFDTRKVTNFRQMFNESTNLHYIYVGENWSTVNGTGDVAKVFAADTYLPNFSRNNPSYRNLSYAHTGEGGYLTLKTN